MPEKKDFGIRECMQEIGSGKIRPVYLLCGEEAYLRRQYRNRIADAILPPEDTMNRSAYDGAKTGVSEIISMGETMPFFAESRLLVVTDSGFFKNASPEMADYIGRMPEYLHLIFCESEVDKRNSVYKAVQNSGAVIGCERQSEGVLSRWCLKIFSDAGRKIRGADMEYFLHLVGNDMTHIQLEAEKLISYTEGRGEIARADIEAVTSVEIESRIFDMIRAVTEGRKPQALRLYADLLSLREPPLRILSLLSRQYRQMMNAEALKKEGENNAEIAKLIGAPPFAVKNYLRTAAFLPPGSLRKKLEACAQTEEDIKSGKIADRLGVELLILVK